MHLSAKRVKSESGEGLTEVTHLARRLPRTLPAAFGGVWTLACERRNFRQWVCSGEASSVVFFLRERGDV